MGALQSNVGLFNGGGRGDGGGGGSSGGSEAGVGEAGTVVGGDDGGALGPCPAEVAAGSSSSNAPRIYLCGGNSLCPLKANCKANSGAAASFALFSM